MTHTRVEPATRPARIFFSVGDPSGDVHAANLIRALRARDPQIELVGYGGPRMAEAGCRLHADLTALAVMWFLRALLHLHQFLRLLRDADRYFAQQRPDAVVLVDYPGFNWWVARRAKARGVPVYYYLPPQIWAWASWRVKKMRRSVDHVLCGLPFEQPWFAERGVSATYVGHPFFDEVQRHQLDPQFLAQQQTLPGPLVALLPGSRSQEVTHNLVWFLKAAEIVRDQLPQVRFAVASFNEHQADLARQLVADAGLETVVQIHLRKTPELMHLADGCLAVSGSVSLELLHHLTPTAVLYWISPLAYFVQGLFRHVKYITLVNLLASDEVFPKDLRPYDPHGPEATSVPFPEYLTCEDRSAQLARHVIDWLTQPRLREEWIERLRLLRDRVGRPGASARVADWLLERVASAPPAAQPHFAAESRRRSALS